VPFRCGGVPHFLKLQNSLSESLRACVFLFKNNVDLNNQLKISYWLDKQMTERIPEIHDLKPAEHQILKAVRELRFGAVEIVIHEARVTEIKQIRRFRVENTPPVSASLTLEK
jgi:hypothetical protein